MQIAEIIEAIQSKASEAKITNEFVSGKLASMPTGILATKKNHGKIRYYQRAGKSDTTGKYLSQKEEKAIRELEEKAYYSDLQKATAKQIEVFSKIEKLLGSIEEPMATYLKIPKARKHLIKPLILDYSKSAIRDWDDFPDTVNAQDKKFMFKTKGGEIVRSKSELIIADRLKAAGIPYHYEYPVNVAKRWVYYPDFTALNVRTGEIYYWEHFGLMDNPSYCEKALAKIENYAAGGITQGNNLIVSMESEKHQLNTQYIDRMISLYLL